MLTTWFIFAGILAGPDLILGAEWRDYQYDLDADGDVDLADFAIYQRDDDCLDPREDCVRREN